MITAEQARKATDEQLIKVANMYVQDNASRFIKNAIEHGEYSAICRLSGIPNATRIGNLVVEELNKYGYRAKFVQECNGPRYEEAYVVVDWKEKA